jgi:hypothetical protein
VYYYIFEPPQGSKEYERTTQIKEYIASLGIAGEIAQPGPGRSVADLVTTAISKRYSTIIAVGSPLLLNSVAHLVSAHDAVFGMIPLCTHPDPYTLIGSNDWKSAATALKRRRWIPQSIGYFGTETCFLTPARLTIPLGNPFTVETAGYDLTVQGGLVEIAPEPTEDEARNTLRIRITLPTPTPGRFARLFSKPQVEAPTLLHLPTLNLVAFEKYEITVAGSTIGTTPGTFRTGTKPLKLIVGSSN